MTYSKLLVWIKKSRIENINSFQDAKNVIVQCLAAPPARLEPATVQRSALPLPRVLPGALSKAYEPLKEWRSEYLVEWEEGGRINAFTSYIWDKIRLLSRVGVIKMRAISKSNRNLFLVTIFDKEEFHVKYKQIWLNNFRTTYVYCLY